jgi:hypothetical protein
MDFFLEGKNLKINNELTSDLWEEVLDKGYSFRFKVFGVSMLPLIRAGDILTIKPVEYVDLSIGDRKLTSLFLIPFFTIIRGV